MQTTTTPAQEFARQFYTADKFPHGSAPLYKPQPDSLGFVPMVLRGPFSFCAYVGFPLQLAKEHLHDFQIACHYGVTYSAPGHIGSHMDAGMHWIGWDYAHGTDALVGLDDLKNPISKELLNALNSLLGGVDKDQKAWTLGEVIEHAQDVHQRMRSTLLHAQETAARSIAAARSHQHHTSK